MKILLLLTLSVPFISFSQIKVVDSSSAEKIGEAKVSGFKFMECYKDGEIYGFTYKDMKFTHINEWKTFVFFDKDNAFDNFYSIIISVLETGEGVDIEIPNGRISISPKKVFGRTRVEFFHTNEAGTIGMTNNFNRKQIDNLFGK